VNGSGEVHCLAARKTEMVRFDVFAVHQPQYADFSTEPPDVQMRTQNRQRATEFKSNWRRENKPLASAKPLRASPQGQHDETANSDVIGNEHGIPTAQPRHVLTLGPATILNLYRIAHSESTVG
jgi:hypothetical protein